MRKVTVLKWDNSLDGATGKRTYFKTPVGTAFFHKWGVGYEEFESGPGNYSAAIVEHEDGQIETVPADLIKFDNEDHSGTWVLHILGPDDVIQYPDELTALREANKLNKGLVAAMGEHNLNDPFVIGVVKNSDIEPL